MWWLIGIGGFLALMTYLGMLFTFGLATLGKGRGLMFAVGLFLPLLWLVGALLGPADGY